MIPILLQLAPLSEHPFLDTTLGSIIVFIYVAMFFLGGVAAGVAGLRSLFRAYLDGKKWGATRFREAQRKRDVMDQLLSAEGWPNGSQSLPDSLVSLYSKVDDVTKSLEYALGRQEEILKVVKRIDRKEVTDG